MPQPPLWLPMPPTIKSLHGFPIVVSGITYNLLGGVSLKALYDFFPVSLLIIPLHVLPFIWFGPTKLVCLFSITWDIYLFSVFLPRPVISLQLAMT